MSAVKKANNIVSHFNSSPQAEAKLIAVQREGTHKEYVRKQPVGVLTDVVTRWWSTLRMCERIIYLRTAMYYLPPDALPVEKKLEDGDWSNLKMITKILKPVAVVQKYLKGEQYITSCFVPSFVHHCRKALQPQTGVDEAALDAQQATCLKQTMKSDFDQRWGSDNYQVFTGAVRRATRHRQKGIHPAFVIAAFLHPQLKLLKNMGMDGAADLSKDALCDDIKAKMIACSTESTNQLVPQAPINYHQQDNDIGINNESDVFDEMFSANQGAGEDQNNVFVNDLERKCKTELDNYKHHPIPPVKKGENLNLLTWWKANESLYSR